MTNTEIILTNTALLIADGVIAEDTEINTYVGWRLKGFQVKKGAEHVAEFPIWIKAKKKQEETEEEAEEPKKKRREFVLQKAFWFTDQQVEPITKAKKQA